LIKKDKIILSEVKYQNIDFLYELLKERKSMKKEYGDNKISTFNEHKKFVKNFIENNEKNNYDAWYIISLLENDKELKNVGAIPLKKDGEWGYQILKKYHNKGIGQIAAKNLFELHPKKQFWGRCQAGNDRARHLLEKLGFELTELTFKKKIPSK
jgi:RimJ/RimL family protein N-acetyltransferase